MLLVYMPDFPMYELSCTVFFLIPMLIIIILYTKIGKKVFSSFKFSKFKNTDIMHDKKIHICQTRNAVRLIGK